MIKKMLFVLIFCSLMGSVSFAQTAPVVTADAPAVQKGQDPTTHKSKPGKKAKKKHVAKKPKEVKPEPTTK